MNGLRALVLALCTLATAVCAQERSYTLLEREVEYLMEIWPGDYDNREQVQFDFNKGKRPPDDGAHHRVHSRVRRVALPAFGEHVLYVEEYRDNDPANIFRRGLYEVLADEDENAIRIRVHSLPDAGTWSDAGGNVAALATLTPADTTTQRGCDLFLNRNVDALTGGTRPQACSGDGYAVRITESGYWFRDRELSAGAGDAAGGRTAPSWYQLERARWFQCMLDFPREDGGRPVNTVDYVRIHDQGGTYPFTYRDGRDMVLTVRNTWSYGMQRETLVVVVQEGDESGPTLVYAWGEPDSDRIGVNPGWIRLQCDLDTAKMRRFQRWLRPDS